VIVQARSRFGDWLRLVRLSFVGTEDQAEARAAAFRSASRLPAIVVPARPR